MRRIQPMRMIGKLNGDPYWSLLPEHLNSGHENVHQAYRSAHFLKSLLKSFLLPVQRCPEECYWIILGSDQDAACLQDFSKTLTIFFFRRGLKPEYLFAQWEHYFNHCKLGYHWPPRIPWIVLTPFLWKVGGFPLSTVKHLLIRIVPSWVYDFLPK